MNKPEYLFVDLDGTLIRTDLFVESLIRFLRKNPLNILKVVYLFFRRRSVAKALIARHVKIRPETLPYEIQLVDYLREEKKQGRRIILATAAHWTYANRIAAYLTVFEGVIASNANVNLKGVRKLARIRDIVGNCSFAYAGGGHADRPILQKASSVILVNASYRDVKESQLRGVTEKIIASRKSIGLAFLKQMRIHHWAKNVLIFVPLLASHKYLELDAVLFASIGFLCFSLCASAVYFLNDLLDFEPDRLHATKRHRPLAAGEIPIGLGVLGAVVLTFATFTLAVLVLPLLFLGALALYCFTANAYSLVLKRISTADVLVLAVLYTLRVIAGAAAIDIELSSWLLAFSVFIFVSLAYLKRYMETAAQETTDGRVTGRGYSAADSETMFSLGIANATASVLVLALYINSQEVTRLYASPKVLWLLCLLLLYWSNRIWVGARRGKINEDPVVFAIRDHVSRMVGIAFLIVVFVARYLTM